MPYFVRNEAISLWYLDEGPKTAPAVVLLHGMGCDLHDWSWQVPFLLGLGFRVVTPDLRGQGRSSAPPPTPGVTAWPGPDAAPAVVDYFPETMAHDVVALLEEHLAIHSAVFVAHSLGDLPAYYLATIRPDLVRASVALGPIYLIGHADRETKPGLCDYFDDPPATLEKLAYYFQHLPGDEPAWLRTWHVRRMRQLDPMVNYAMSWGAWGTRDTLGRTETAVERLGGKMKCPRLVCSNEDAGVAVDRDQMPRCSEHDDWVVFEGRGHWFHQEEPEKFNAMLKAWFDKIGVLPSKAEA